ncbi:hypothetical protein EYR40_003962 [Pleurotus pulmonarius]|nr:hypothetical protein EYR36_007461 [Pleurotus pulmonarius]KAF4605179.1 hypothetical protein EYR40_003962 [Pleurotus pulmonarius]KAF4606669.1 hypothetical protein EYR38_000723 [Pleurotus pulmonarius]
MSPVLHNPQPLEAVRRVVVGHDERGNAVVKSNELMYNEDMAIVPGAKSSAIWVTTDGLPTNDTNSMEDGATRVIEPSENYGLVPPRGTNVRSTDLAPGAITPMHRTSSVDYNILVEGEIVLITEDGAETHLRNPGDTVVQKGTMHAWRNPGASWARWVSVLISAEPAVVNGRVLHPEFHQPQ